MAHKQFLHELLREDQEPFQLKSYIADRCSEFKKHSYTTTLGVKKCKPIVPETSAAKQSILCKNGCLFSFQDSPDVRKSPFLEFPSPVKSPCKSSNSGVFLHIPATTTALLVEAAIRIQNPQQSKPKTQINRFGLFGSILKRLKDGNKNKKRAIGNKDTKVSRQNEPKIEESIRISCSCTNSRLSSDDSSETNEDKSMDLEASTSSYRSEDFASREKQSCSSPLSPFRFSMHNSPSSSGRQTPDFYTPAASPSRHLLEKQRENFDTENSEKVPGDEDHEEKEQCSPVSVLDPSFDQDFENCHGSEDADEDDYDLECSYANVQRAKQQLLYRLQRFEKLAELDPMELERKLLEGSDDDGDYDQRENEVSEEFNKPLSPYREHSSIDMFVNETFNTSTLKHSKKTAPSTMKLTQGYREIVLGGICNRLDSWKELEFNTIDMMIESDVKTDYDGWKGLSEHLKQTAEEIEVAIFGILMEQLSDELSYTRSP